MSPCLKGRGGGGRFEDSALSFILGGRGCNNYVNFNSINRTEKGGGCTFYHNTLRT